MQGDRSSARRGAAGVTLIEVLLVVAIMGMAALLTTMGWQEIRSRSEATSAARLAKILMHQARMQAVYQGVNYFVIFDSGANTFEIFSDTGSTPNVFDTADERVARSPLQAGMTIALPTEPTTLPNPLDATTMSNAWALPASDTGGGWGTTRKGVMITPRGLIQSGTATPQLINSGVIVFTNGQDETTAVAVRGRLGDIRSYHFRDGAWKEI